MGRKKTIYSSADFRKLTGLSSERLRQLRVGFKNVKNEKEYFIKPKLEKETDWFWDEGQLFYTLSALKKLS